MAYDLKYLQALTATALDEQDTDFLPAIDQPIQAVDLWFWRPSNTYNVAYKPADDAPSPKRADTKPPPKPTTDKTQPKRGDKKAPKLRTAVQLPIPTDDQPSPKFREAETQIKKARKRLVRLQQELRTVTYRVKHLDPSIQARAFTGEVQIDLEHMMEQLNELNREVKKHPNQFEWVMAEKYGPLMKRIETINRKLTELESPEPPPVSEQVKQLLHIDKWP